MCALKRVWGCSIVLEALIHSSSAVQAAQCRRMMLLTATACSLLLSSVRRHSPAACNGRQHYKSATLAHQRTLRAEAFAGLCCAGAPEAADWVQTMWTALQQTTTANPGSLLSLPDQGVYCWLRLGQCAYNGSHATSQLREKFFVRPCWPALWAQIHTAAASDVGTARTGLALAAGTSGTGRRLMLLYALWRLSRDPSALAVVVQLRAHQRLAFCRGQRVYEGDGTAFDALLEAPGTWLLTLEDCGVDVPTTGAAHVLMVIHSRSLDDYQVCRPVVVLPDLGFG